jgi:hypothetical protein
MEEHRSKVGPPAEMSEAISWAYFWPPSLQLSIYSSPPEPVTLAEVRGPLEDQVASARTFLSDATKQGRDTIRGQVDRWIGVEKAVESE